MAEATNALPMVEGVAVYTKGAKKVRRERPKNVYGTGVVVVVSMMAVARAPLVQLTGTFEKNPMKIHVTVAEQMYRPRWRPAM